MQRTAAVSKSLVSNAARYCLRIAAGFSVALLCALGVGAPAQAVGPVSVQNLVTDDQTVNPAQIADPALVNPWGVSYFPTGPFWVSDNGSHVSTLYQVNPATNVTNKQGLTVTIPGEGSVTGQVFNGGSQFNGNPFLFVSEDGTISGWRNSLGTNAETLVALNGIYKGVTLSTINQNSYLYAANFRNGTVDVVKGAASAPNLSGTGNFTDPDPNHDLTGFAPFNVQNIGDQIYVTYAKQDAAHEDDVAGAGNGVINKFDLQGNFLGRFATGGALNSPWGMVIAPSSFGAIAGDLLVGNFGDGKINVFDPKTGQFIGTLTKGDGSDVEIEGLWALIRGNGGSAGSDQNIFFSAGPGDESHGLFGVLSAVPEPSTWALVGFGLSVLFYLRRRRFY
jgi:uncharacterized protein (TIGR03118 family)